MRGSSRGSRPLAERLYGWLLRAYPARFRRRYGAEMIEMFRDARREAPRDIWSRCRQWAKSSRDLLANALAMRLAALSRRLAPAGQAALGGRPHSRSSKRRVAMASVLQDVRFALRTLRKSKGYAAVAVITIALGIGANSAIFSVVNAVLLRPLPYPAPDRLVMLWTQFPAGGDPVFAVSPAEYLDYRDQSREFQEMGAFGTWIATLTGGGAAERVVVAGTSATLLDVLGFRTHIGRVFTADEDRPGLNQVALLTHGFWRRRFGGAPDIVGRTIGLNGVSYEVLGVLQESTKLPGEEADVWIPPGFDRGLITDRSGHYLTVVGRLAPSASLASAFAELESTLARWPEQYAGQHTPNPETHPMTLVTLDEQVLGEVRPAILVLAGAVAGVLLLACANVANLMLARGEGRIREIGLRAALGAGRARISRQLLTESLVVSLAGGGLGLVIGKLGTDLLVRMDPGQIPRLGDIGLSGTVVTFTVALSLLTGMVFGLLPSLRAARTDLAVILASGGRGAGQGRETRRTLSGLVVAQVALAVVLLIGSGLLIKSFAALQHIDPGFDAANRLSFDVSLSGADYPQPDDILRFYHEVTEGVRALPGVGAAAVVRNLPLYVSSRQEGIRIEGKTNDAYSGAFPVQYQGASPDYFTTAGIPLLQGRVFTEGDRRGQPLVAVVNETAARTYWKDEDPVGWRIRPLFARDTVAVTIVGVVGDVRQDDLAADVKPELYLSLDQTQGAFGWIRSASIIVQTDLAPSVSAAIRRVVAEVDENVPVANLQSLDAVVANTLNQERFMMWLLAVFAGSALVIAAVGVYGVMSFSVVRRTQEIGIRLALGAPHRRVLREVVAGGLRLAALGTGLGVTLAFVVSRVLESQLYGVSVRDGFVFTGGVGVLVAVSLIASLVPALRASRVDPNLSLRSE